MSSSRLPLSALFVVSLVVSASLSGCATIFNGTEQEVQFDSEPSKADIMIGGVRRGTTPATLTLTKPGVNDRQITFVKEGYEEKTITLQKKFATASILNVIGPTFVGFGIDALSGALFNYYPTEYTVEMEAETASARKATPSGVQMVTVSELQQDEDGNVIVPPHEGAISVFDAESGAVYVFGAIAHR